MPARSADIPLAVVVAVVAACLAPFLSKAFHMDDPLFLWTAHHLRDHPLDFYGFDVNWYGRVEPISGVMKNPPLAAYYMATAASVLGWSEASMHLAFLLPALGVVAGTWLLARELCARPGEAALASVLTPVVLVSSTTVMCDVLMLCAWVWAVLLWVRGLRERRHPFLALAAALVAASALTKYFGASLVPLLFAYGLARERRLGAWAAWLAAPIVALAGYQWLTRALYGRGLLLDAATYAQVESARPRSALEAAFVGLAFAGGCHLTAAFYAPRLWSRRQLAAGVGLAGLAAAALAALGRIGRFSLAGEGGLRLGLVLQYAALFAAGASLVALCVAEAVEGRDPESVLLVLWAGSTLAFAAFVNWSLNGRSLLPLAPALGILAMRRIDRREPTAPPGQRWRPALYLVPAATAALLVCQADFRLAEAGRQAAEILSSSLKGAVPAAWFEGHWGFQWYAERAGLKAIAGDVSRVGAGEAIVVPANAANLFELPAQAVTLATAVGLPTLPWLTTMSPAAGAGFYTDRWGGLPFVVGRIPPERYLVYLARRPLQFGPPGAQDPAR